MGRVNVGDVELSYEAHGEGETVVLAHSYLVDRRQYAEQIAALRPHFRVLAYDHRGHGESDRPREGYDMETLYRDAEAFIERTGAAPCHFVGHSTGGFVGLRLGFRRPELLRSLVLMDTSADAEPWWKRLKYAGMFAGVRVAGLKPFMPAILRIMFGPSVLADPERRDVVALWRERMMAGDVDALIAFGRGIFARDSVLHRLPEITAPTLVIVGEDDVGTPPHRARRIAEGIPGARLQMIPRAGHLSTVENPGAVNEALLGFLRG